MAFGRSQKVPIGIGKDNTRGFLTICVKSRAVLQGRSWESVVSEEQVKHCSV